MMGVRLWPKADTRTLITERPLSVKADIRQQAGAVLHIYALFRVIAPRCQTRNGLRNVGPFFVLVKGNRLLIGPCAGIGSGFSVQNHSKDT